jgi:putative nucleotidyltransferase with HDIG domain
MPVSVASLLLYANLPIFHQENLTKPQPMADEKKHTMWARFGRVTFSRELATKVALALALVVLVGLLFPRGEAIETEYKVGGLWPQNDLYAPFSFPILRDPQEYQRDVEAAQTRVYPVFERDAHLVEQQIEQVRNFFARLREALRAQERRRRSHDPSDSVQAALLLSQMDIKFLEHEWGVLASLSDEALTTLQHTIESSLQRCLGQGIIDVKKATLPRGEIALRKGTMEEILPLGTFLDEEEAAAQLERDLLAQYLRESDTLEVARKIALVHMVANVKYNRLATERARQIAIESVPRTAGFVQEGDRIIGKNERITPEIKQKIDSLRKAKHERGFVAVGSLQVIGTFLHVAMVLAPFVIYLRLFRKRIFGNNRRLALIALLILMECFFAYLTYALNVAAPLEYLIVVPAASMLLTIIFDSRVGLYGTVVIAYLVGGVRGNDYAVALAALVAGALAVYTVRDIRNRSQIIRSFGFIFLGYAITILALGLERIESVGNLVEELTFALANSLISPVLTFGLLIFFERYFDVTTDLTLIELGQFHHPLLKMLSEKAPGTYHHSMTMANLAEAAAAAVGANEVLARVGAYFHDIGKIEKPTYFVENQKGSRNRHDKLAPRMSSLIIQNHVKKGIALAREYGLPEEVVDFIPQHHGTTLIDFFYRKALALAERSDDETKRDEINEQDYRYPGPKPQTKETGILMLADSIEAAARALEDPSPQKLEAMIDELVKKRFEEGELDECPLTLKDLTKIKKAFLNVLVGVYHSRVKYPEEVKEEERKERTPEPAALTVTETEGNSRKETEEMKDVFPAREKTPGSLSRTIKAIDNQ